jgi:GNAT superfamily N-acetyltransferase
MIESMTATDHAELLAVINDAAQAYCGVIPADRWHEPYFGAHDLEQALAEGVVFSGIRHQGRLQGVMGIQRCDGVALIRHAYVRTVLRGQGLGSQLLQHLLSQERLPILIGTWAAAEWAIRFYRKHVFRVVSPWEKDALLRRHWKVPPRQIETSVVLADRRWLAASLDAVAVELARAEEAPLLLAVQKAAFEQEARACGVRDIPPMTQSLGSFAADLATHVVLTARLEGQLVGMVRGRLEGQTCHVGRLAVHPDVQGRGIGRRLAIALEARFPHARRFELFTGARSEGNLRLYASLGYRTFRTEPGTPELVFMEKSPA